jgi:MYXO-CTERM domain-containing protein
VRTGPAADTFVEEAVGYRDVNHGDDTYLNLGTNSYPNANRTYLLFDVEPGLAAERILAAHLHLNLAYFPYGSAVEDEVPGCACAAPGAPAPGGAGAALLVLFVAAAARMPRRSPRPAPHSPRSTAVPRGRPRTMIPRCAWAAVLVLGCSSVAPLPDAPRPDGVAGATAGACPDAGSCRPACEAGDSSACVRLGERLYEGARMEDAAEAFGRACDAGDVVACLHLGGLLGGSAEEEDVPRALAAFRRACAAGLREGCVELGILGREPDPESRPVPEERAESVRAGLASCTETPDADRCLERLALFLEGTYAFSAEEVEPVLRSSCDLGQQVACLGLAWVLERMDRCEEAEAPLQRACEAAVPGACAALGSFLFAMERAEEALPLLRAACGAGEAAGCSALASLLYGDGRLEDAFAAYEKACAGDDVLACLVAADVLDELGRPEDAAALLVRACERGALDACEATPGDAAADPFVDLAGRGRTTAPTPPGRPAGP